MTSPDGELRSATRVFLRPLATPLPLGFLALAMATSTFAALQLGWIPPDQRQVAGLTAIAATLPLQLLASVFGYLSRDPVAGTGMAVLGGTWGIVGLDALLSKPGSTSPGLGVLLITAGVALLVPAISGSAKLAAAGVMAMAAIRFGITGGYELTASPVWKAAAGWAGIALGVVAVYSAFALELEGAKRRMVLPVGRSGLAKKAVHGEGALDADEIAREAGVRPRL